MENDNTNIASGSLLTMGLDRCVRSSAAQHACLPSLRRSSGLIEIAKSRRHEVLVGDAIDMPWREGLFVGLDLHAGTLRGLTAMIAGLCHINSHHTPLQYASEAERSYQGRQKPSCMAPSAEQASTEHAQGPQQAAWQAVYSGLGN